MRWSEQPPRFAVPASRTSVARSGCRKVTGVITAGRLSLSFVVRRLLASAMNDAVPSHFRTDALATSEAFDSMTGENRTLIPSRSCHAASVTGTRSFPERQTLRFSRCISPVRTFAFTRLSAMRSPFHARTPDAFANPTRTPNHALQPTGAAVTLAAILARTRLVRPQPSLTSAASFFASPLQPSRQPRPWLSLGSLGLFSHAT